MAGFAFVDAIIRMGSKDLMVSLAYDPYVHQS